MTVGQALTAPDSGWKRIDDSSDFLKYKGVWESSSGDDYYSKSFHYTKTDDSSVSFSFYGSKIRIIGLQTSVGGDFTVIIDEVEYTASNKNSVQQHQTILFENIDLSQGVHTMTVKRRDKNIWFDAIDIDGFPLESKLIIKNPMTNQNYSLADKTLIPLPDTSDKNIILHGIEAGKEINLDEDFDKINYPVNEGLRNTVKTMVKPLSVKFE